MEGKKKLIIIMRRTKSSELPDRASLIERKESD